MTELERAFERVNRQIRDLCDVLKEIVLDVNDLDDRVTELEDQRNE